MYEETTLNVLLSNNVNIYVLYIKIKLHKNLTFKITQVPDLFTSRNTWTHSDYLININQSSAFV